MITDSVWFKRLLSALATLGMLIPTAVSEYEPAPELVPGEALAPSPFSCVAKTEADIAAADDLALAFNAVYRLFGGVDRENALVSRNGNEPTYYEWMAIKTAWCRDPQYIRSVQEKIRDFPQTDNGYLWSWGTSPCWPTGNGALHYDGLFRYVAAVAEFLRWAGDGALLKERDRTTCGDDLALDASKGRSVYQKCVLAMRYAHNVLGGKDGLITLTEQSAFLADGATRFDIGNDGSYIWNNTGRAGSSPSNYWDNLCFGHKDAYETALYYHALHAMADIERMRGSERRAAIYETRAAKVKEQFNRTFWDKVTGRYIACVDADGKRWDPGLTFLNTEALAYGLGDAQKAKMIFSWLDGTRIIPSDTLRGKQIMDYAVFLNRNLGRGTVKGPLPFVPATNTRSIERISGLGEPWWYSLDGAINIGIRNNAFYGQHLENGGYIFYTTYYELVARQMYLGADSVQKRARELAAVYRFNGFHSDVGFWAEGLNGEFPENGIVSRVFISALAGITATVDGLTVRPDVPSGIQTLGVDLLQYCGVPIRAFVSTNGLHLTADAPLSGTLRFYPQRAGTYTVTVTDAAGRSESMTQMTDADGALALDMAGAVSVAVV